MPEVLFDIEVPPLFFGPLELQDGRLLAGDVAHHALHSTDGGRTWTDVHRWWKTSLHRAGSARLRQQHDPPGVGRDRPEVR